MCGDLKNRVSGLNALTSQIKEELQTTRLTFVQTGEDAKDLSKATLEISGFLRNELKK